MTYSAYETASGEALKLVETLCRHVARDGGGFSANTVPSLDAVERYLTTGYYWTQGQLRQYNYSTTQSETEVLGVLQLLNAYQAAIQVELSLPTNAESGAPSARFQTLIEMRDSMLGMIQSGAISQMGATEEVGDAKKPVATGLSIERKKVMTSDTDATQHRIRRNQFSDPHNPIPATRSTTEDTDS